MGFCDQEPDVDHDQIASCRNWRPVVGIPDQPTTVVGGAPHGFGVWVGGKYHPVDIGALGKVITDLQEQLELVKKEHSAAMRKLIDVELEAAYALNRVDDGNRYRLALFYIRGALTSRDLGINDKTILRTVEDKVDEVLS